VVAIAAGFEHCLALRRDGTVVVWGNNESGQTNVPPSLTNVVAIAAGMDSSLALKADGTLVAWGSQKNVPVGLSNIVAIATGGSFSLALLANGTVVGWGPVDSNYQFGATNVPPNLTNVVSIAADWEHSLALIGDGPAVQGTSVIAPRWEGDRFACAVPTQSGRVYQLEYKLSLSDPDWRALPLAAGTGRLLSLTDTTVGGAQRFYRVRRW
jgi:alpha-tubulin suppressor-like RCC1 family protein